MAINQTITDTLKTPPGDRPWYKRWTILGGLILAAANYLETQQVLPAGTYNALTESGDATLTAVQSIGGLLAGLGVYRQISSD
jgi:hypothetical protein